MSNVRDMPKVATQDEQGSKKAEVVASQLFIPMAMVQGKCLHVPWINSF